MSAIVQILVGGGGLFALIQYIISSNAKQTDTLIRAQAASQDKFLEHLEKKNGHLERIATQFNQTVREFGDKVDNFSDKIEKLSERINEHERR